MEFTLLSVHLFRFRIEIQSQYSAELVVSTQYSFIYPANALLVTCQNSSRMI